MIPAVISATTEMTAIVEKRGTARVASGQRSAPANTQSEEKEGEAAGPEGGGDHVDDVRREPKRVQGARMPGEGRGQCEARAQRERQRRQRPAVVALRMSECQRRQRERRRQCRLDQDDLAVPRVDDRREEVPRERVGERQPACCGSLEEDVHQRHDCQRRRDPCQDAVEATPDPPLGGLKRHYEDGRAADREEEKGEVEEPTCREEDVHGFRRAGERVYRDCRADAALEHVEDEGARDGIGIRRDSAPRHRVGAGLELGVEPDHHLVRDRLAHLAVVHLPALPVKNAQRAERGVDRLVELEDYLSGRLRDDHVVSRLGADEHRVRGGGGREYGSDDEAHGEHCKQASHGTAAEAQPCGSVFHPLSCRPDRPCDLVHRLPPLFSPKTTPVGVSPVCPFQAVRRGGPRSVWAKSRRKAGARLVRGRG